MFQFPGLALFRVTGCPVRVSPFGNLRVYAYVRLTVAYRSLPRPSSPPDTKVSTVRP
jgi:hypothetical protein